MRLGCFFQEPAKVLRELLQSGANLKDRCAIRLENDMRYGEVRMDHWLMHAKVVDLPTVVESMKTIDNKSFYKTADICQMVMKLLSFWDVYCVHVQLPLYLHNICSM